MGSTNQVSVYKSLIERKNALASDNDLTQGVKLRPPKILHALLPVQFSLDIVFQHYDAPLRAGPVGPGLQADVMMLMMMTRRSMLVLLLQADDDCI